MSDLADLQARLGHVFRDAALLQLSLTHPSVAHEQGVPVQHNQRLEFLGDAVLQLILTRELYEKFPDFGEGPLTKARAKLVNRRALAEKGKALDLGAHLIVSRGEAAHGGRERPSALADTFEAVLGADFPRWRFCRRRNNFVETPFSTRYVRRAVRHSDPGKSQGRVAGAVAGALGGSAPCIMWRPPAGRTTTATSNAPSSTKAGSWRAAAARARKRRKARRHWRP